MSFISSDNCGACCPDELNDRLGRRNKNGDIYSSKQRIHPTPDSVSIDDIPTGTWTHIGGDDWITYAINEDGVAYWKGSYSGRNEWGLEVPHREFEPCPFLAGYTWSKVMAGWALRSDGKVLVWGESRRIFFDNGTRITWKNDGDSYYTSRSYEYTRKGLDVRLSGAPVSGPLTTDDFISPFQSFFTKPPAVNFTVNDFFNDDQVAPTGVAVISGWVAGISVLSGGSGYTAPPVVTITGGGGDGATAEAWLNDSGSVCFINIVSAGSGYSTNPVVSIAPPPASASGVATATATATATIIGQIDRVEITSGGLVSDTYSVSFTGTEDDSRLNIAASQLAQANIFFNNPNTSLAAPASAIRDIGNGIQPFLAVPQCTGANGGWQSTFNVSDEDHGNALRTLPGHVESSWRTWQDPIPIRSAKPPKIVGESFYGHGDGSSPYAYVVADPEDPLGWYIKFDLSSVTQSQETHVLANAAVEYFEERAIRPDSRFPDNETVTHYLSRLHFCYADFRSCPVNNIAPVAVYRVLYDDVPGGFVDFSQVSVAADGQIDTSVPPAASGVAFTNPYCWIYTYDPRPIYLTETFKDVDSVCPLAAVTQDGRVYCGDNNYKLETNFPTLDWGAMRNSYAPFPSDWGDPLIRDGNQEPSGWGGYSVIDVIGHAIYYENRIAPHNYYHNYNRLGVLYALGSQTSPLGRDNFLDLAVWGGSRTDLIQSTPVSMDHLNINRQNFTDPYYFVGFGDFKRSQIWVMVDSVRNPSSGEYNGATIYCLPVQWHTFVQTTTVSSQSSWVSTAYYAGSGEPEVLSYKVPLTDGAVISQVKQSVAGGDVSLQNTLDLRLSQRYFSESEKYLYGGLGSLGGSRYLLLENGDLYSLRGSIFLPTEPTSSFQKYDTAISSDRWVWQVSSASRNHAPERQQPIILPGGFPFANVGKNTSLEITRATSRKHSAITLVYATDAAATTPEEASQQTDNYGVGRLYASGLTFSKSRNLSQVLFCGDRAYLATNMPLFLISGIQSVVIRQQGDLAIANNGDLWSLRPVNLYAYDGGRFIAGQNAFPLMHEIGFSGDSQSSSTGLLVSASGLCKPPDTSSTQFFNPLSAQVVATGSGYKSPAQVVVGSEYQDPSRRTDSFWDNSQRASWSVSGSGRLGGISVINPGSGFREPPSVSVSGNASAVAHIQGPIEKFNITSGGSGYRFPPEIVFSGEGIRPPGELISAEIDEAGSITSISIGKRSTDLQVYPRLSGSNASASSQTFIDSYSTQHPYPRGLFSSPPAITILPPLGISSINILSGGSMYQSPPSVRILSDTGKQAEAAAFISGPVDSFIVTKSGSGYSYPPRVLLSVTSTPPDPNFANDIPSPGDLSSTLDSGGNLIGISVSGSGGNVCVPPTVEIVPVAGVLGISVDNGGGGYDPSLPPAVTIDASGAVIDTATAEAVVDEDGSIVGINVTNTGGGYDDLVVTVTVDPPPSQGVQATATAIVGQTGGSGAAATCVINGSVYEAPVSSAGYGYEQEHTRVLFLGGSSGRTDVQVATGEPNVARGSGSGATATAEIDGKLLYIEVTNSGSDYSSSPTVTIAPENGSSCQAKVVYKTDDFTVTKNQEDYLEGVRLGSAAGDNENQWFGDSELEPRVAGYFVGNFLFPDVREGTETFYQKSRLRTNSGIKNTLAYHLTTLGWEANSCAESIFPTTKEYALQETFPPGIYSTTPPQIVSALQSILVRPITEIKRNGFCFSREIWESEKYNGQMNFWPFPSTFEDGYPENRAVRIFPFVPVGEHTTNYGSGLTTDRWTYDCYVCNSVSNIPIDLPLAFNLETTRSYGLSGRGYHRVATSGVFAHTPRDEIYQFIPELRSIKWDLGGVGASVYVEDSAAQPAYGTVGQTVDSVQWGSVGSGTFRTSTATQILHLPAGSWKQTPEFSLNISDTGEIISVNTTTQGILHSAESSGVELIATGAGEGFFASPKFAKSVAAVRVVYSKGWDNDRETYMRHVYSEFFGQSRPSGINKTWAVRNFRSAGHALSGQVVFVGGDPIEGAVASPDSEGREIEVTDGGLYAGTPRAYFIATSGAYFQLEVFMSEDTVLYGVDVSQGGGGFSAETELIARKTKPLLKVYTPGFVTKYTESFNSEGGEKSLFDVGQGDITSSYIRGYQAYGVGLGDPCGLLASSATLYPEFAADLGIVSNPYNPEATLRVERLFSDNGQIRDFSAASAVLGTFQDGRVISCLVNYIVDGRVYTSSGYFSRWNFINRNNEVGISSTSIVSDNFYTDGTLLPVFASPFSSPFPGGFASFPGDADSLSTFLASVRPVSEATAYHSI